MQLLTPPSLKVVPKTPYFSGTASIHANAWKYVGPEAFAATAQALAEERRAILNLPYNMDVAFTTVSIPEGAIPLSDPTVFAISGVSNAKQIVKLKISPQSLEVGGDGLHLTNIPQVVKQVLEHAKEFAAVLAKPSPNVDWSVIQEFGLSGLEHYQELAQLFEAQQEKLSALPKSTRVVYKVWTQKELGGLPLGPTDYIHISFEKPDGTVFEKTMNLEFQDKEFGTFVNRGIALAQKLTQEHKAV
ncbi:MAG: hypothetical protein K2X66_11455 [Cyanobacteria bacterium]|nr:hypothetical protein [Cyanobacteriota bacterium]